MRIFGLTEDRWKELGEAAPVITAADAERLKTFRPSLTPIALAVRMAFAIGWR